MKKSLPIFFFLVLIGMLIFINFSPNKQVNPSSETQKEHPKEDVKTFIKEAEESIENREKKVEKATSIIEEQLEEIKPLPTEENINNENEKNIKQINKN